MSDQLTLSAETRDRAGKGASRELRRQNRVPAVIYGNKQEPELIHVEEKALVKLLMTGHFSDSVVEIDLGGKTQIIDDIIESFPDKMDNYHELFTGGGSVLLALLQNVNEKKITIKNKIYAYDINETLINIYKNIQKKPDDVIKNIKKLIIEYSMLEKSIIME
jgi:ribosomal protein L25 (general stress protein Ctc)